MGPLLLLLSRFLVLPLGHRCHCPSLQVEEPAAQREDVSRHAGANGRVGVTSGPLSLLLWPAPVGWDLTLSSHRSGTGLWDFQGFIPSLQAHRLGSSIWVLI